LNFFYPYYILKNEKKKKKDSPVNVLFTVHSFFFLGFDLKL